MESWWTIPFGDIIAIVLLTITIAVIFLVSSLDRKADLNHKKRIACESVKQEIQDARSAFGEDSKYELIKHKNNISYRLAFLFTDAYDSLIHSGNYLELSPKVQNKLSSLYSAIKMRNDTIEKLSRYYDAFFMNDVSEERKKKFESDRTLFEIGITDHENFIKGELDSIEKLLDEENP
jgi:hypothetical protein